MGETLMRFKLLLGFVLEVHFFFPAKILDTTFPFKMPVGITLGRPKTAGEAIFDSASNAKGKLWFKVSAA